MILNLARPRRTVEPAALITNQTNKAPVIVTGKKRIQVMISYAHADAEFCHQLVDALQKGKIKLLYVFITVILTILSEIV